MDKIIKDLQAKYKEELLRNNIDILCQYYEPFLRCRLLKNNIIQDYEFSKEEMIEIFNFVKNEKINRFPEDNRLVIRLDKNGVSMKFDFDKEFAEEHSR
ncbi:hypothetical protein P872_21865 [Rhodonellum psychrophilum GCM71 = DSM 17998]|uniref:Uncharacterized protein n=2 Tax=Rhodonellum TaxID=336827 RepID=U5BSE3_9BACT|nr:MULTISPECIES: hypothetical protein [Rhodonellum]ERM80429.1 hypothetical protein P872_21865 [Rhodonellum psychrophilum GCM71 = DSM 17998]SDZ24767.1 hypothetical protein SAMN05444412_108103 [Rhodonellum ikkaensis]